MKQLHFFDKNQTLKGFREQFDLLLKEQNATNLIKICFFLLCVLWLLTIFFLKFLPPQIPLLFSKPWGESQLLEKKYLLLAPIIVSFFFVINNRLASISISKDKLMTYIFLATQLLVSFFAITTVVRIIILLA